MGTPNPAAPSLGHPSSRCLLVCASQLLLAPSQDPPAPTGSLGHPLLHFHLPVCSCSEQRGNLWAVVKGRDGERGEGQGWEERRGGTGTSLDKVRRLWSGLSRQQGGEQAAWPLLFSPPALCAPWSANTASPQPQTPSRCRHCRG